MSSQRYASIPSSPPPSFRSRDSSPSSPSRTQHFFSETDPLTSEADRTLADTFDSPSDDEDDDDHAEPDDRQRLMRGQASTDRDDQDEHNASPSQNATSTPPRRIERRVTQLPVFVPSANGGRVYGGGNANDGVFSNLAAKPASGDLEDEKPPVSCLLYTTTLIRTALTHVSSPTKQPPRTLPLHTGKPPSWPQVW